MFQVQRTKKMIFVEKHLHFFGLITANKPGNISVNYSNMQIIIRVYFCDTNTIVRAQIFEYSNNPNIRGNNLAYLVHLFHFGVFGKFVTGQTVS